MRSELPAQGSPAAQRQAAYQTRFLIQVHKLLELGYTGIGGANYPDSDEETISGDLCEAIEETLDTAKKQWMRFYHVENEKPVQQKDTPKNSRTRKGKRRQRIDIGFVRSRTRQEWMGKIEAKISQKRNQLRLLTDRSWAKAKVEVAGFKAMLSKHERARNLGALDVFHTLLDFSPSSHPE